MKQFIQVSAGLLSEHQEEIPVFEKIYTPPDYGDKLVSRLYSDGSLYYLNLARNKTEIEISEEQWNFIVCISPERAEKIKEKLKIICNKGGLKSDETSSKGEFDWKVNCNSKVLHHHFFGLPKGEDLIFSEVDEIINKG